MTLRRVAIAATMTWPTWHVVAHWLAHVCNVPHGF